MEKINTNKSYTRLFSREFLDKMYLKHEGYYNMVYSVDMLRLRTDITYTDFSNFDFHIKVAGGRNLVKYYESNRYLDYRYNYVISDDNNNTFWVGFLHNTEGSLSNEATKYNLTVEFNPNKIKENDILRKILCLSDKWLIKSCDIAIDIPVSILDIVIDKGRYRELNSKSRGFDDKTFVIGKGANKVKFYNKKNESKLDIPFELTRIELSIELDYDLSKIAYISIQRYFPDVFLNNYLYTFSNYNDKTLLAILYAVQSGYNINDLSRAYKNKIKNLLEAGNKINFDKRSAEQVLKQVCYYYFINHPTFHFR